MKRFIKFILNAFPRSFLQRAAGWTVPLLGLFYIGRGRECPLCGCRRRRFLPYGYVVSRPDALCPRCLALERHRLLWLYLERETRLTTELPRLLHVAPEVSLMCKLRRAYRDVPERYATADLESPLADLHFDIQHIPLPDGAFDAVICNHIMEHVEDDRKAMRELRRILRAGGRGIVLAPVDYSRAETFEDDATPPSGRAYSASTTIAAYTDATMPTVCARRVSRSRSATMPPSCPPRSASVTLCRRIVYILCVNL